MDKELCKRLARAEKMIATQRSELTETLQQAYDNACSEQDETTAAELARKIRDKLLDESDKQMTLDRLGLDTSTATKFISSLASIFSGEWATYRQSLRDLPEQEGFPFNVTFPTTPTSDE